MILPHELLERPTLEAAATLVGALLVHETQGHARRVGRIVEVEAYIGVDDRASHARFGRTERNAVMFGAAGRAYVYLVYGMYECLNVVTEADGHAAAVLIRAVEPTEGGGEMRAARLAWAARRRGTTPAGLERLQRAPEARLASGPGLVTVAFGITRSDTGRDLCDPASPLRLEVRSGEDSGRRISTSPRIGIDYAEEPWRSRPWRFFDASSPAVSGGRLGNATRETTAVRVSSGEPAGT